MWRRIAQVPVGAFAVTVLNATGQILGSATGAVAASDQGGIVNITVTSGITLPATLFDGNGFQFDVNRDGQLIDGTRDAYDGAFRLRLYPPGGEVDFFGSNFATLEDNQQQIGISQNLAGLNVTRKIYVPADGYFARYLEILNNPTSQPVTLTVQVEAYLGSGSQTRITATSSGDLGFSTNDFWVVHDDDNGSQPFPQSAPATADVIGGPGAARTASEVFLASLGGSYIDYQWNAVTVPAGQTVILMHFAVQQVNSANATAAVQRLVQLPAEAIAAMTAAERSAVVNFNVPADGSSPLPPLPLHNAAVTGTLWSGDGFTPVASASIALRSLTDPFLSGAVVAVTGADGTFTFNNVVNEPFALVATNPYTLLAAPAVNGQFANGQTTATQNIVLAGTGVLHGTVRRNGLILTADFGTTTFNLTRASDSRFMGQTSVKADGTYAFAGVPPDNYVIVANFFGTNGYAYATVAANQATTVDITVGIGAVAGRVSFARGIAAPNSSVILRDTTGNFLNSTVTGGDGRYTFSGLATGRLVTVQAFHPTSQSASVTSAPVAVPGDGQTATQDLTLPASASVQVKVVGPDGSTPLPNVLIEIQRPSNAFLDFAGNTDATGVFLIPNVPQGTSTIAAFDNEGQIGIATTTVAAANDNKTLTLLFTAGVAGEATGTLFAADGVTRLSYNIAVWVEADDAATDAVLASGFAYGGSYGLSQIAPGAQGFKIRVRMTESGPVVAEALASFSSRGEVVSRDFALAFPVVKGFVSHANSTPVSFPDVFVTGTDTGGEQQAFFPTETGEDGSYTVVLNALGLFTVTAQDSSSGASTKASVTITTMNDVVQVNLALPATASLTGRFFDAAGIPVGPGYLILTADSLSSTPFVQSDPTGLYKFAQVPVGRVTIQACDLLHTGLCRTVTTVVDAAGSTLDIFLPALAAVDGFVFAPDGVTPVPNAGIHILNTDNTGPFTGPRESFAAAGPTGHYHVDGITVGTVVVEGFNAARVAGSATTQLTASGASINIVIGGAVEMPLTLVGADGFQSNIDGYGEIQEGGAFDGSTGAAYSDAVFVQFQTPSKFEFFRGVSLAKLDTDGRQLTLGPLPLDGLFPGVQVTRKIFVPVGGGFARYLDEISNTSAVGVTFQTRVFSDGATEGSLDVDPADTANTYAVVSQGSSIPALGLVFAGAGGQIGVSPNPSFDCCEFEYDYHVTIAPGQTIALMHFAIQRQPNDTSGAEAQAQALVGLTDPQALVGMTAAEKAMVINFNVPH